SEYFLPSEISSLLILVCFCELSTTTGDVLEPVKTLFIDDLCVANSARGQKIGEQLYEFALSYAKEQGCHNLTLDVWADNAGAVRFYERQGMKPQKFRMEQIIN
ncbi:GNAT family N-acetyltransferase, partial [Streptococcus suis]|uniref:GNAT family N-acetyltransferase n=1 Tax=Streptococcus suis TaxID=1307 RepID=UPI0005CE1335